MNSESIPEVPCWTLRLMGLSAADVAQRGWDRGQDCWWTRVVEVGSHQLISIRIEDAVSLDAAAFEAACAAAYQFLAQQLESGEARHPVRLWNYIPEILAPLGDLPHRYMVFNAGRFDALSHWLEGMESEVATASGVGHFGKDLVVHCLASASAGVPVENPRQIAAYRYSARYGPKPPCFARATRMTQEPHGSWLMVGGTASVCGEDSVHLGDLEQQLRETMHNLSCVVYAGTVNGHRIPGEPLPDAITLRPLLDRYLHLRVYYVRREDREAIDQFLEPHLAAGAEVEYLQADLCRPELLVEIEGLAELNSN